MEGAKREDDMQGLKDFQITPERGRRNLQITRQRGKRERRADAASEHVDEDAHRANFANTRKLENVVTDHTLEIQLPPPLRIRRLIGEKRFGKSATLDTGDRKAAARMTLPDAGENP